MLVFCFKVALDHNKRIYRNIEIIGNQNLDDLHEEIFSAFDRDVEHLYSFYLTKKPTKSKHSRRQAPEYTELVYVDDNPFFTTKTKYDSSSTKIQELDLKIQEKFYYLFDFVDEWWHELTLLSVKKINSVKGRYPKIVKTVGNSPDQYPDYDEYE